MKNSTKPKLPASVQPTEVELEILEVLWALGPAPLGVIHEACVESRPSTPGYTTTQKMLQVMREKGLVVVDDSARPMRYAAAEPRGRTQLKLLDAMTMRAFGGSAKKLVMSMVAGERLTLDELAEVKKLINQAQKNQTNEPI
jgi:BlaI family transcriptional regulator, penicillinase repressor